MKRFFVSLVNTVLFITLPVWGGTLLITVCLMNKFDRRDLISAAKGERWLFE